MTRKITRATTPATTSSRHDQAAANYKRLFDYLDRTARTPDGPALEITMIDQGFTSNASEFLTEIQVPLKPY